MTGSLWQIQHRVYILDRPICVSPKLGVTVLRVCTRSSNSYKYNCSSLMGLCILENVKNPHRIVYCMISRAYTEKTIFLFPFTVNGI